MNLIDAIDNYLLVSEAPRPRESHYASDAIACRRQLYYKWTSKEVSNPIPAGGLWKMRMGDSIHNLVHEFLSEAKFEIVSEVSGEKQVPDMMHPIHYRLDNLFVNTETGNLDGIEVKTSYGNGIRAIVRENKPKEQDLAQVAIYLFCAALDQMYLIYVARDDGYRTQFIVEMKEGWLYVDGVKYREDLLAKVIDRLKYIEQCVETRTTPPRDFVAAIKNGEIKQSFQKNKVEYRSAWQCMYCRFLNYCWAEEVEKYVQGENSEMFADDSKSAPNEVLANT